MVAAIRVMPWPDPVLDVIGHDFAYGWVLN